MSLLDALQGTLAELERNEREKGPPVVRIECGSMAIESLRQLPTAAAGSPFAGIPVRERWDLGPYEYAVVFEARRDRVVLPVPTIPTRGT